MVDSKKELSDDDLEPDDWPVGPDYEEQPSGRRRDSTDSPVPNGRTSPGELDEAIIRVAQI
jgi:hypothetical protein